MNGGSDADNCEGQGLGIVRTFPESRSYNSWRTLSPIPLRIDRNCPHRTYTMKCTVTYTEPGSDVAIPVTCNGMDFTVGSVQQPASASLPKRRPTRPNRRPRPPKHRPKRPYQQPRPPKHRPKRHVPTATATPPRPPPHQPPRRLTTMAGKTRRQRTQLRRPRRRLRQSPRPPRGSTVCLPPSIKASKLPST